eukprot:Anaeramoba_ignava/a347824_26.p1 GENE.a347824_26~~a347824_26.p1  ORF type:complete len:216 (-),score=91.85 a347824_26:95-742(-)
MKKRQTKHSLIDLSELIQKNQKEKTENNKNKKKTKESKAIKPITIYHHSPKCEYDKETMKTLFEFISKTKRDQQNFSIFQKANSNTCSNCNTPFTTFYRKNICNICSESFCSDCLKFVPYFSSKLHVCSKCEIKWNNFLLQKSSENNQNISTTPKNHHKKPKKSKNSHKGNNQDNYSEKDSTFQCTLYHRLQKKKEEKKKEKKRRKKKRKKKKKK